MPFVYHLRPQLTLLRVLLHVFVLLTLHNPSLSLECYECSETTSTALERCRVTDANMLVGRVTVITCNETARESCSSHAYTTFGLTVVSFTRSCRQDCLALDECITNDPFPGDCRTCCSADLCNERRRIAV